ncbi:hypothetical protein KC315_g6 [Hortaea werneckii]|nr:hypothetical protein KC315_g6 [Hortaea werneckii]
MNDALGSFVLRRALVALRHVLRSRVKTKSISSGWEAVEYWQSHVNTITPTMPKALSLQLEPDEKLESSRLQRNAHLFDV